jgi:hypothetical protein
VVDCRHRRVARSHRGLALLTLLSMEGIAGLFRQALAIDPLAREDSALVRPVILPQSDEVDPTDGFGLTVRQLSVIPEVGRPLLSDVNFEAQPGTMTAIIGGKRRRQKPAFEGSDRSLQPEPLRSARPGASQRPGSVAAQAG